MRHTSGRSGPLIAPLLLAFAAGLSAQIDHGAALVLGPLVGAPPTPLTLVDVSGVQPVAGLDPATLDASAIAADHSGAVWVGLRATNTGAATSLDVRFLYLDPIPSQLVDVHYSSLMSVPAGQTWEVADLSVLENLDLLVLARQVPISGPGSANVRLFRVDFATGNVQQLHAVGLAQGVPVAIVDLGDRYAVAVDQPGAFLHRLEIQTFDYAGIVGAQSVATFVGVQSWGGMAVDINGELVVAVTTNTGSLFRLTPRVGAAVQTVSASATQYLASSDNGAGLVVAVAPGPTGIEASHVDTLTGASTGWLQNLPSVFDIAVRDNPAKFGALGGPSLGAAGGAPSLPNANFGLRFADPGSGGLVVFEAALAIVGPILTPYGYLSIDPASAVVIGTLAVGPGQVATLPYPLPAVPSLVGTDIYYQSLFVPTVGSPIQLSRGLAIQLHL